MGFTTAVTDGVLGAQIPLLEMLPVHGRGIGGELVRRVLVGLENLHVVDLLCDPESQPFYASPGTRPAGGVRLRRYEKQPGTNAGGAIY